MAYACAHCGSVNTQVGVNRYQCLDCGQLTDFEGNTAEPGIDETTRAAIERTLEPRSTNVVGNLADLQRAGAAVVKGEGSDLAAGVEKPAGVSDAAIAATAEAEAKVAARTEGGDEVTTTSSRSSSKEK